MYSNNDFRDYQELYHAEGEKKKWNWLPGGKNPPEYNHWYYMTHPEKWDITKKGKEVLDAAGKKVNEFIDNSETELDNKLRDATKTAYNTAKNKVTNTNAYQNAKSVVGDIRKSTEASQRKDDANRRADKAASAAERYKEQAKVSTGADRQRYLRLARQAEETEKRNRSQAGQESVNAKGYAKRASNTAKSSVTNTADMYKGMARTAGEKVSTGISNTVNGVRTGINRAISNSPTQVDNDLRRAAKNAVSGNFGDSWQNLKRAGQHAKEDIGDAVNNTVERTKNKIAEGVRKSDTMTDDFALRAIRNATNGNWDEAKADAKKSARQAKQDVLDATEPIRTAVSTAVSNVTDTANRLKNAAKGVTGLSAKEVSENPYASQAARDSAKKSYDNSVAGISNTAKNNSIQAAKTASKSISDIYQNAKKELSDIGEKFGWNSPEYLKAVRDAYTDVKGRVTSLGSDLRTRFENAPGTVNSAIESGLDWISNGFEGLLDNIDLDVLKTKNKYDEEIYTQGGQRRSSNSKK